MISRTSRFSEFLQLVQILIRKYCCNLVQILTEKGEVRPVST